MVIDGSEPEKGELERRDGANGGGGGEVFVFCSKTRDYPEVRREVYRLEGGLGEEKDQTGLIRWAPTRV